MTIRPLRPIEFQDAGRTRVLDAGVCAEVAAPIALSLIAQGHAVAVLDGPPEVAAVFAAPERKRRKREVTA